MVERIAIFFLIMFSALVLSLLLQRILLRRRAGRGLGLKGFQPGRPAILYFTAPGCVPCKLIQRPALQAIADQYGESLQIFEVDATKDRELANRWAVLSVPTTFLIDSLGRPRKINNRAAPAEVLIRQLSEIGEDPEQRHTSYSSPVEVLK